MAAINTYDRPPRRLPTRAARNSTMARAMPVISSNSPSTTNIGTASSSIEDMPWSIWLMMTASGMLLVKCR